jgi:hypothetical protein
VEPLTSWNAIRVQTDIAGGKQGIGFMSTITQRFFNETGLPDQMNRGAYTLGVDGWTFLDNDRKYVLAGWFGSSLVTGTALRMTDVQEGSVHYFQRPDQDYMHVDSSATSLAGFGGRLVLNKQKGNVQLNASLAAINPGLELNDIGFAPRTDMINSHVVVGYRWTHPTRSYQRANFNVAAFSAWDFGLDNTALGLFANGNMLFNNFWSVRARVIGNVEAMDVRATRGGPAILSPPGYDGAFGFSSDDRKRLVYSADFYFNRYQEGANNTWGIDSYVEWRPTKQLQVSVGPSLSRNLTSVQYIGTYADPTATATYGNRYVFGNLDQWTLSGNIRLNWIFTPKLSLELFMQPFVSSGNYRQYSELTTPGTFDFNVFGENGSTYDPNTGIAYPDGPDGPAAPIDIGDQNFQFGSLRGNAVLRWEWSPGSTLFVVWTHNRANSTNTLTDSEFNPGQSFDTILQTPADNVLLVKFTWWLNP